MSQPAPALRSARLDYLRRARRERRERMVAAVGIEAFRWLERNRIRDYRARVHRIEIHL